MALLSRNNKNHSNRTVLNPRNLVDAAFFALLYALTVGYAMSARKLSNFIEYVPFAAMLFAGYAIIFMGINQIEYRLVQGRWPAEKPVKQQFVFAAGFVAVSIVAGLQGYSVAVALLDVYGWMQRIDPSGNRSKFIALSALGVIAIGGVFFWIRLRYRFTYGLVEAAVGVAFAVHRLALESKPELPAEPAFYFAMLTASIYLVVRGLDNMHQGWKEANDPLVGLIAFLGIVGASSVKRSQPRRLRRRDGSANIQLRKARRDRIVETQAKM
jgi:hypothetical protein